MKKSAAPPHSGFDRVIVASVVTAAVITGILLYGSSMRADVSGNSGFLSSLFNWWSPADTGVPVPTPSFMPVEQPGPMPQAGVFIPAAAVVNTTPIGTTPSLAQTGDCAGVTAPTLATASSLDTMKAALDILQTDVCFSNPHNSCPDGEVSVLNSSGQCSCTGIQQVLGQRQCQKGQEMDQYCEDNAAIWQEMYGAPGGDFAAQLVNQPNCNSRSVTLTSSNTLSCIAGSNGGAATGCTGNTTCRAVENLGAGYAGDSTGGGYQMQYVCRCTPPPPGPSMDPMLNMHCARVWSRPVIWSGYACNGESPNANNYCPANANCPSGYICTSVKNNGTGSPTTTYLPRCACAPTSCLGRKPNVGPGCGGTSQQGIATGCSDPSARCLPSQSGNDCVCRVPPGPPCQGPAGVTCPRNGACSSDALCRDGVYRPGGVGLPTTVCCCTQVGGSGECLP